MNNKVIDGKMCVSRDVVYSSSVAPAENLENKDVVYSWDENDQVVLSTGVKDTDYADPELRDTQYSSGLSTRLIMLKRPLAIQLIELYKDHQRMYKSKGSKLKQDEIDILLDDFRYELHRIVAKAKDSVVNEGGNLDTLLRLSSFQGGIELTRAAKSLTVLFKRIETAYTTFGYIPRDYQTKLNDALSVLISHFIMDIYGPELERRKQETSVFAKSSSNVR
jgi:hypothetical protein